MDTPYEPTIRKIAERLKVVELADDHLWGRQELLDAYRRDVSLLLLVIREFQDSV
jgi:hypothetical protein